MHSVAQTNRVPSWHPEAPIRRYRGDDISATESPRDEHGHLGDMGQDLLRQNAGGDRPDVATGLGTFNDDSIGPGSHQTPSDGQGRGKGDDLHGSLLQAADISIPRQSAGQNDMAHLPIDTDADEFLEIRVQGDEIDTEGTIREFKRGSDFSVEHVRSHGATCDDTESPGIRKRGNKVSLGEPSHGTAHDGVLRTQQFATTLPQPIQLRS